MSHGQALGVGHASEGLAEFRKTACLRARLIIVKFYFQGSRDREGAVLFAHSAEFGKSR